MYALSLGRDSRVFNDMTVPEIVNRVMERTNAPHRWELTDTYRLQERLFVVRVPKESDLHESTLAKSRLGDAFDFRLLAMFREGDLQIMPEPDEVIHEGDLLLIQGRPEDLDVLRGLSDSLQQLRHVIRNGLLVVRFVRRRFGRRRRRVGLRGIPDF